MLAQLYGHAGEGRGGEGSAGCEVQGVGCMAPRQMGPRCRQDEEVRAAADIAAVYTAADSAFAAAIIFITSTHRSKQGRGEVCMLKRLTGVGGITDVHSHLILVPVCLRT